MLFNGKPFALPQPYGTYVMENVLFKISYPAEFHGQTAVECALQLHAQVHDRLAQIERVVIETQESAVRIIDKTGPLANPADRDHCIQYMVAIPLIFGHLTAADYEDAVANDPRVDELRNRMVVRENTTFTQEYYAADKRYIGNAVQVFFKDGTATERVHVDVPLGHRKRRAEAMPVLDPKIRVERRRTFPGRTDRENHGPVHGSQHARGDRRCRNSSPGWSRTPDTGHAPTQDCNCRSSTRKSQQSRAWRIRPPANAYVESPGEADRPRSRQTRHAGLQGGRDRPFAGTVLRSQSAA